MSIYKSSFNKQPDRDKEKVKEKPVKQKVKKEKPEAKKPAKKANPCLVCAAVFAVIGLICIPPNIFKNVLLGLFGLAVYPVCILGVALSLFQYRAQAKHIKYEVKTKYIVYLSCALFVVWFIFHLILTSRLDMTSYGGFLGATYRAKTTGGGVLFSLLSYPIVKMLTRVGAYIFSAIALAILVGLIIDYIYVDRAVGHTKKKSKFNFGTISDFNSASEKENQLAPEEKTKKMAKQKLGLEKGESSVLSTSMPEYNLGSSQSTARPMSKKEYILTPFEPVIPPEDKDDLFLDDTTGYFNSKKLNHPIKSNMDDYQPQNSTQNSTQSNTSSSAEEITSRDENRLYSGSNYAGNMSQYSNYNTSTTTNTNTTSSIGSNYNQTSTPARNNTVTYQPKPWQKSNLDFGDTTTSANTSASTSAAQATASTQPAQPTQATAQAAGQSNTQPTYRDEDGYNDIIVDDDNGYTKAPHTDTEDRVDARPSSATINIYGAANSNSTLNSNNQTADNTANNDIYANNNTANNVYSNNSVYNENKGSDNYSNNNYSANNLTSENNYSNNYYAASENNYSASNNYTTTTNSTNFSDTLNNDQQSNNLVNNLQEEYPASTAEPADWSDEEDTQPYEDENVEDVDIEELNPDAADQGYTQDEDGESEQNLTTSDREPVYEEDIDTSEGEFVDEYSGEQDTTLGSTVEQEVVRPSVNISKFNLPQTIKKTLGEEEKPAEKKPKEPIPPYVAPPAELLQHIEKKASMTEEQVQDNIDRLEQVLADFKVPAKVNNVKVGPAVTRYELTMPRGISVNKIATMADDIAMTLASNGAIRVEAPIPGKNSVGIEVPNDSVSAVSLRELIESPEFRSRVNPLSFVLGKDINGDIIFCNLDKMPHLLVAGSTGSGKSVCLNTMLLSMCYKAGPEDLRLILVDPKMVEFSTYNGLPHLLIPEVITGKEMTINALDWAIKEMERRYALFAKNHVVNINDFNKMESVRNRVEEKLPFIVIVVDELADLMLEAKREIEDKIAKLAAKARAAGIHLVLATQRPSVDVITGTVKANLPSRIAFALTNYMDSKTVLDGGGAEKLMGKGDMLFKPQDKPEAKRVQGAFVTTEEITRVVQFIKDRNKPVYDEDTGKSIRSPYKNNGQSADDAGGKKEDFDPVLKDALRMFIQAKQASGSMISRRYSVGFNRAGRIMDQMFQAGFIGPPEGAKPRQVLITMEEFEQIFGNEE